MEDFKGKTVEELGDAIREGMRAFTEGAPQSDDVTNPRDRIQGEMLDEDEVGRASQCRRFQAVVRLDHRWKRSRNKILTAPKS